MTVAELWQANRPFAALRSQTTLAESNNDDTTWLQLFEMACCLGKLKLAARSLARITRTDEAWQAYAHACRALLIAEHRRRQRAYGYLVPPAAAHVRYRRAALRACQNVELLQLFTLVDRADAETLAVRGHVDGREFEGLRDIDDLFASMLEVFLGPRCLLVGWESLRRLELLPLEGLLDEVYRPAKLTLHDGTEIAVRLPLTYPGSVAAGRAWALGREGDRIEQEGGLIRGVGGRMLLTQDEEFLLSACQQIDFAAIRT